MKGMKYLQTVLAVAVCSYCSYSVILVKDINIHGQLHPLLYYVLLVIKRHAKWRSQRDDQPT